MRLGDPPYKKDSFFNRFLSVSFLDSVDSVTVKELVKPRPLALNTVELMRAASAGLGLGPHNAMQIAERLYTQGYISYPRTETTSYPTNFDLKWESRHLRNEFEPN